MRLVPVKPGIDWAVLQNIEASKRYQMNLGIVKTVKLWTFDCKREHKLFVCKMGPPKKKTEIAKNSEDYILTIFFVHDI